MSANSAEPAIQRAVTDRRLAAPAWTTARWRWALVLLALATFAIRARYFGNPFIDVDEEFYLLTGDRMLHGAIPYLDIWDRKPIGLFLLYAAIRSLGGDGIVQYQLVAAGFVAATAIVIAMIARRIATPAAALVVALAYVPALAMSGGQGGQTPVFYNLPMALAAWLIFTCFRRAPDPATIRRHGAVAMLLVGVAMQIKYSAVFEGVYFGLALMWLSWRAKPRRAALLLDAVLCAALAIAPTAIAYLWYAAIGQRPAFVYANFTSIAQRGAIGINHQLHDLQHIALRLLPFLIVIGLGLRFVTGSIRPRPRDTGGANGRRFLVGWLVAAVIGFAAFGSYFNHYALPLLVPLAIVAAPSLTIAHRKIGPALASFLLAAMFIPYPFDALKLDHRRGDAAYARTLAAQIAPRLQGRCLYVFYGEPILYQLTDSCLPTRWAFPFHLSLTREAPALGVDAMAEARRIMATRPPVVVDRLNDDDEVNLAIQRFVRATLVRDYTLVFSGRHPLARGIDVDQVWALKDGR